MHQHTVEFRVPDGAAAVATALHAGLCLNDQQALRALHERGLRMPEDVSVVGFDDVEGGRFSVPTQTTVTPDKRAVAAVAVGLLRLRIAESAADAADRPTVSREAAPAPQERSGPGTAPGTTAGLRCRLPLSAVRGGRHPVECAPAPAPHPPPPRPGDTR